jgi:hypothetical protein
MRGDANKFLCNILGEEFFELLAKTELYKPTANVAIDIEDIRIGLKVVPRVVMSMLIRELPHMRIGESKQIHLLLGNNATMNVNKVDTDTYSGSIVNEGAVLASFKYRPLPGVGLVIMSAFELYELEELDKEKPKHFIPDAEMNVQKLIDDRMALHSLINSVFEQKIAHKDALHLLMMNKLTQEVHAAKLDAENERMRLAAVGVAAMGGVKPGEIQPGHPNHSASLDDVIALRDQVHPPKSDVVQEMALMASEKSSKKQSPLKGFLDKKLAKKQKNEFEFKMVKGETIECPDCRKNIFDGTLYSGCICLGDDSDRKVFIKKSVDKYSIRFSKGWDLENIEMLVDVLRKKNG